MTNIQQEANVIWQRLHRMTPTHCTRRLVELRDRQTDELTDLLTDTAIIGNNSLHLTHSMQPKIHTEEKYYHAAIHMIIVLIF